MLLSLKLILLGISLFLSSFTNTQNDLPDDNWFYAFSTCVEVEPGADTSEKYFIISELFYLSEYDYDDVEGAFFDQVKIDYEWATDCWNADFEFRFEERREGINHRRENIAEYKGDDFVIKYVNLYN